MEKLLFFLALAVPAAICWLWIFAFREKKTREPEQSAHARLKSRQIRSGANRTGRSKGGYSFYLIFQLNDGSVLELASHEEEYGALREGMSGKLTWKGPYFVSLKVSELYGDLSAWAQEEHRTVDAQIEYLLTECVKQKKKNAG